MISECSDDKTASSQTTEELCENPPATSEESCDSLSADTHTTATTKSLASLESSTPPEPCLDIGTIVTQTKSISDICHTVGNLSNAEKISFLFQHMPSPAVLPTTFSHGCNRKFNISWLTKYPWLRYSPKLDAVLCGPYALLLREVSRKDKGWFVNRPFSNRVKLSEVLQNHSKLTYHRDAVQSADVLKISIENPAYRIDVQMSSSLQSQMAENKHILRQIV